jgi:hypothetical protein
MAEDGGRATARRRLDTEALAAALPGWIVARFLVLAGLVVATVAADRLVPGSQPMQIDQGLLAWDGSWYAAIADKGYEALPQEAIRFFPLYPLLGRAVSLPLLGNVDLALLLVSNGLALVLGALIYRLAQEEGLSVAAARRAAWFVAILPPAFVLVWGYAEAVMLVASVACFLALRREQWLWAAAFGAAAALSRPLGILLVVPAAIEVARGLRASALPERAARLVAVIGPAIGTGVFLLWSKVAFDDLLLPFSSQDEFRGSANPVSRLADAIGELGGAEGLGDGLHLPYALGLLVLLYLTFRRLPVAYGAYAGVVLIAALSADNLNSLERYGLNAFPLVLALAATTDDEIIERLALLSCAGGILAFSSLAWLGAYVP